MTPKRPGKRCWYISPEGFRDLRHSCLLSRHACAVFSAEELLLPRQ